jgi:hypothetical protein
MAITVKVDPIDRDIRLMIDQTLSPKAQSAFLAEFARNSERHVEENNARVLGRDLEPRVFVDGHEGADESEVRPNGVIVYEFQLITNVLLFIGQWLEKHSPHGDSGDYEKSHTLYADGVEVEISDHIPLDANEYVFLNLTPYARKIEGVRFNGGGRKAGESSQAPDGVYELGAAAARKEFGNVATISYEYRSPTSGAVVDYAKSTRRTSTKYAQGNAGARLDWLTNQPAIVVYIGTKRVH